MARPQDLDFWRRRNSEHCWHVTKTSENGRLHEERSCCWCPLQQRRVEVVTHRHGPHVDVPDDVDWHWEPPTGSNVCPARA